VDSPNLHYTISAGILNSFIESKLLQPLLSKFIQIPAASSGNKNIIGHIKMEYSLNGV
jgi:hypothetical protein